ncbi:2-phospho-L-lactate guanylyltransferase [Maioricimonas rarisocia]|uniref:2-phospho-L-lactate guanylyltransferase n=1 Tax=Maioricimonas rarisocia TaxID=2528026 RepID=A0A517Z640_9PLAN|nr:TIGR04282 family arsenosugar biosynthesis glycosyltransferase [Maioricimonas rarisocia]QDU37925.1 2-phospho-L-lactate guanylyltransferase [Maioricimonas rarisocia]
MFVKWPRPGQVKTRLARSVGPGAAVEFYQACVEDMTDRLRQCGDCRILAWAPDSPAAARYFSAVAGEDFDLWLQPQEDLGGRLERFFEDHACHADDRVVVIGSDSPTLPVRYLEAAWDALKRADCVIGPAVDGGYYLVGLRKPVPELFEDIDWDSSTVLAQTIQRVRQVGVKLALLDPWYDVDTLEDVELLSGHLAALDAAGETLISPRLRQSLLQLHEQTDGFQHPETE